MCIFARSLRDVLSAHGKRIGSLYTVRVDERPIPAVQIMRLQRAADGDCAISVTLNPEQLDAVRDKFGLDQDEVRQLKTALLAESQFRLLMDRVSPTHALQIADGIFHLLLDADNDTLNAYGLDIDIVRGDIGTDDDFYDTVSEDLPPLPSPLEQQAPETLEPALQAYDEAALWLERARIADHPGRRAAYAGLASSLLTFAVESLNAAPLTGMSTDQRDEWMRLFARARGESARLAGLDS